jgi:hypothetical protein
MVCYRDTDLVYATFLPGNLPNRLSEYTDMIYAKRRYPCDDGPRNGVGTIVSATYTNLQYGSVDLVGSSLSSNDS